MARGTPAAPEEKRLTLSDADITSRRAVTRRSMLAVLGISAGVAAATALATAEYAPAADNDSSKKKKKKNEETDSD